MEVAIVDAGVRLDHLRSMGLVHPLNEQWSYTHRTEFRPGQFPPGHGTTTAFQVGVAAPQAGLIDQAVVFGEASQDATQPLMQTWLSDITPAFERLREYLVGRRAEDRRLVVSNSWAMIRPEWDWPIDHEHNFSDNEDHPFCRLVRSLIALGPDVWFSAGNCGEPWPVRGCGFAEQAICGANSLPEVITVGAVDLDGERLGYSSQGPGRLALEKPDICAYSHYAGSNITSVDWGTSVSCPLAAGVVAAVHTVHTSDKLTPASGNSPIPGTPNTATGR